MCCNNGCSCETENLDTKSQDLFRARQSLIEELQAIDLYEERIQETDDVELKKVLMHNQNEEREHAALLIEYLRKRDAEFDKRFKNNDLK